MRSGSGGTCQRMLQILPILDPHAHHGEFVSRADEMKQGAASPLSTEGSQQQTPSSWSVLVQP